MLAAMHMDPLLPVLVGACAAMLLVGLVMRKLRQPHVIAYLLGGVLLGPHGLALFTDEASLARVGDFGVVLLLFFLGMEVSIPRLAAGWRVAVGGTLLQVAASVGCAAALGAWLDWPLSRMVLIGFALSLSSTAVVVSVLRGRGELDSPRGQDAIGILLAQDVVLIPMLVVLGLLSGDSPSGLELGVQVGGAMLLLGLLALIARCAELHLPFGRVLGDDHELQVFAAFLLCFGFAWLTGLAGLSTALGAFVAGVVIAAARETTWVHHSLDPFRVLFVAAFFGSVGMLIDLHFLAAEWALVFGLALITLVVNTLVNAFVLRLLGRQRATSLIVGAMLAQIGEFSFLLSAIGRQAGLISDFGYQVILAVIAVTLALSPAWIALVERLVGGMPEPRPAS